MATKRKDKDLFGAGYDDQSDALANAAGQVIEFYHIPSGRSISFKAYITTFSDQYNSDWSSEKAFGRMDPIQTFKSTSRVISLGWDIPAGSFKEAKENLLKASLLLSMLYPEYEAGSGGATTMVAPPMFKLKFLNLIQDSKLGSSPKSTVENTGLLGTIAGLTYEPDLESGFFQPTKAELDDVAPADVGKLFPQTIKFSAEFTVLHQHKLGWKGGASTREKGFGKFPYTIKDDTRIAPNVAPGSSTDRRSATNRNDAAAEGVITGGNT